MRGTRHLCHSDAVCRSGADLAAQVSCGAGSIKRYSCVHSSRSASTGKGSGQCSPVLASLSSSSAGGRLGGSQPFLGQTFADTEDIHYDIRQNSSPHPLQQLEVHWAVAQLNTVPKVSNPLLRSVCAQASTIAVVPSELPTELRQVITVNDSYIVYGLKGGQIRILHRGTGNRILLRFHEPPLTCLK